jgi:hypothetical protein
MASDSAVEVTELTPGESRDLFGRACMRELGISGEAFLRRYDAGEFDCGNTGCCSPRVFRLKMLVPFGR